MVSLMLAAVSPEVDRDRKKEIKERKQEVAEKQEEDTEHEMKGFGPKSLRSHENGLALCSKQTPTLYLLLLFPCISLFQPVQIFRLGAHHTLPSLSAGPPFRPGTNRYKQVVLNFRIFCHLDWELLPHHVNTFTFTMLAKATEIRLDKDKQSIVTGDPNGKG
ncbi:hypothetical protein PoB_001852900 [Plakobranchus ocellatus]|uniref:Uncharacterized protein n=1 Tax=Plakobranchus ocellatus TaxID=259542 RepID=A0AAV3Z9M4_9GAST|nr:hypothetical protein PoB_001852900 [Plakobranchus ocellatus]